MTIGIDINVKTGQVAAAQKSIEAMTSAMEAAGATKMTLGEAELEDVSAQIRRITGDVTRLRTLANAGDQRGGILSARQFEEVEKVTKRIRANFSDYASDLNKAREAMSRLTEEKKRLEAVGESGKYEDPNAFMKRTGRLQDIDEEMKRNKRSMESREKLDRRMRQQMGSAAESGDVISGFGQQPEGDGVTPWMKSAALAYVGYKVVSFVKGKVLEGMSLADAYSQAEMPMVARRSGVRDANGTMGYMPSEHMAIAAILNSTGGYRGDELFQAGETAKRFGRAGYGDANSAAGYMGAVGSYGSLSAEKLGTTMEKLRDTIRSTGDEGRGEEFKNRNLQLLAKIADSRGGELSPQAIAYITALQGSLWQGGTGVGKGQSGQEMIGALHDTIRSGGKSQGEQVLMWQALGGNNINDSKGWWDFQRKLSGGIENAPEVMDFIKKQTGGDPYMMYGYISAMMPNLAPKQVEELVAKYAASGGGASGSMAGDVASLMGGTQGGQSLSAEASKQGTILRAGRFVNPIKNEFKENAWTMINNAMGGGGIGSDNPTSGKSPEEARRMNDVMGGGDHQEIRWALPMEGDSKSGAVRVYIVNPGSMPDRARGAD